MLSVPEVSQLFDDIMKAASKKAEPIVCNVVLMNAGRQTQVSMSIVTCPAISAPERAGISHSKSGDFVIDLPITDTADAEHWQCETFSFSARSFLL